MNSPAKRRTTPRRKPKLSVSGGSKPQGVTWLNEVVAVVFFGAAFLLAIGLLSYVTGGAGDIARRQNLLGPLGHLSATLLTGLFGWCAIVPVVYLVMVGWYFWTHEFEAKRSPLPQLSFQFISRIVGFIAVMVTAAALIAAVGGMTGGGRLGYGLARPLGQNVNTLGAVAICFGFFLVSLALATGFSVQQLLGMGFGAIGRSCRSASGFLPAVVLGTLRGIGGAISWAIEAVIGANLWAKLCGLFSTHPREERATPKPRVRRNSLAADVKEEADEEDDEGDEASEDTEETEVKPEEFSREDYSHVVVMRRDAKREAAAAKKITLAQVDPPETDLATAFPDYKAPDISLLTKGEPSVGGEDDEELRAKSRQIELKLKDFGIFGRVTQVHPGPVITLFEFEPAPGIKVGRIAALQDDLAMSLRASSIRIIAPLPKLGTVGIEVPNRNRDVVRLRDVLESEAFVGGNSLLNIGIGKDTYGDPVVVDIASMPHLLMAGATGTGKSVCINSILLSLLYRAHPSELGLIMIDPKILELSIYEDVPHLRVPVVTAPKQARAVLDWAAQEMDRRYRLMQRFNVRNIDGYNQVARGEVNPEDEQYQQKEEAKEGVVELAEEAVVASGTIESPETEGVANPNDPPIGEKIQPLPKIVIVIDELADLMLTVGRDIEELITRLAQKARASGIHLLVATQRPSVDVITGLIKANFPARLSFRVATRVDSRTILDSMGAEKLLGRGDMLFMQPGAEALRRVHGAFVSDAEVKRVVEAIKKKGKPCYDERILQICQKALEEGNGNGEGGEDLSAEHDALYDRAVELVLEKGQASTSMIQRAFRIGYNRAARMIEVMEKEGLIGQMDGAKPREVLVPSAGRDGEI